MFREVFAESISLVQYKSTSTDYNRQSCEPILLTNRHTCIVNRFLYRCMQQSLNQKYVTRFLASRRFSVIFYIAFAILLSLDVRYAQRSFYSALSPTQRIHSLYHINTVIHSHLYNVLFSHRGFQRHFFFHSINSCRVLSLND